MSGGGDLLRAGETVEKRLGIDARELYDAIDAGELPARHAEGHGIRLAREDVEVYADTP